MKKKNFFLNRRIRSKLIATSIAISSFGIGHAQCNNPTPTPQNQGDPTYDYFGTTCEDEDHTCSPSIGTCGPELVENGGFESGNVGFDNDYTLLGTNGQNLGSCVGVYTVEESPFKIHNPHWRTRDDVTFGQLKVGNSLICDAACDGNTRVAWEQTISTPVVAGRTYTFSAWYSNSNPGQSNFVNLIITGSDGVTTPIQQVLVPNPDGSSLYGRWYQVCGTYIPTSSGPVTLEITATPQIANTLGGADFALDEISFKEMGPPPADFTVQRQTECNTEFVSFIPDNSIGSHVWTDGQGNSYNTTTAHTVYSTPGTYTITHTISLPNSSCQTQSTQTINVIDCTPPTCDPTLMRCGNNLAVNGDFELGNTGFSSNLTYNPVFTGFCDGRYTVDNSSIPHAGNDQNSSNWDVGADHTSGSGKFMIVDPPCISSGAIIWQEGVSLIQGRTYSFTCWVSNLAAQDNSPNVLLRIDGNPVSQPTVINRPSSADPTVWKQLCGTFTAPFSGSFPFEIEVGPSADAGIAADLGLDDVEIYAVGQIDGSFIVGQDKCAGSNVSFTSTGANGGINYTHSWDFGDGQTSTQANPTNVFNVDGTYTVTHTITDPQSGCTETITMQVEIENCCSLNATFNATSNNDQSDCTVSFDGIPTANGPTTITGYEWSYTDGNSNTIVISTQEDFSYTFPTTGPHFVCFKVYGQTGGINCETEFCDYVNANCNSFDCLVEADFTVVCDSGSCSSGAFGNEKAVAIVSNTTFTPDPQNSGGTYTQNWFITSAANPPRTFTNISTVLDCFTKLPDGSYGTATVSYVATYTLPDGTTCSDSKCVTIDLDDNCSTTDVPCDPAVIAQLELLGGSTGSGMRTQIEETLNRIYQGKLNNNSSITVAPNPFGEKFSFKVNGNENQVFTVNLYDMNGRLIKTIVDSKVLPGGSQFDWTPSKVLSEGPYMLNVITEEGSETFRVIHSK